MKEIKPPMKFDDKNDDNMAKRHAFYSSVDAVKKYLKEEVEKNGHVPPINNVLLDVKAEPRYASFSFG